MFLSSLLLSVLIYFSYNLLFFICRIYSHFFFNPLFIYIPIRRSDKQSASNNIPKWNNEQIKSRSCQGNSIRVRDW